MNNGNNMNHANNGNMNNANNGNNMNNANNGNNMNNMNNANNGNMNNANNGNMNNSGNANGNPNGNSVANSQLNNNIQNNYEVNVKKLCLSDTMDCSLTKSQICKAISEHYMIRNNIIAAIMTVIPKKDNNGKLTSSFCYDRYNILNDGKICLPPDYLNLNKYKPKERIKKLMLFINKMGKNECKSVNGYFKELSIDEKKALATKYHNFNNVYMKITLKLKEDFLMNSKVLYDLLKTMQSLTVINNKSLNEIAVKVKEIIDNMYIMCQKYYINAVLALLKADLQVTEQSIEEEEKLLTFLEKQIES